MILKPDSSLSGSNSTLGMGVGLQVPQQHVVLYSPGAQPVAMPIMNGIPMAMSFPGQQQLLPGQQRFSPQNSGHGEMGMRPPLAPRQMSESMSNGSSDLGMTLSNSMRSAMASSGGVAQHGAVPQYLVGLPGVSAPMNLLGQGVPLYAGTPFHQQVVSAPPAVLHTPLPPAGAQVIQVSQPQPIDPAAAGMPNQAQPTDGSATVGPKVDPNDVGPRQLIVNYLAPSVTESELRAVFEQYGPVQCSRVIYDKNTSQSKGYGFIYYYNSANAAAAQVGLQNFEFRGKAIRVAFAVPQRPLPM